MRALGNSYSAVTEGRGATVALFHPSATADASPPTRGSRLKRCARTARAYWATSPTTSGRPARTTGDSAPFNKPLRNIPPGDFLPSKEINLEALLIKGSKPGSSRVRQAPQIARVRNFMGVLYKRPSNAEFETSYAVFKASRGSLAGGSHRGRASSPRTLLNGSEPHLENLRECFMRHVPGPQADPYRTGHRRPLEPPDNSSPKQPWLAARAWVA